MENAKDRSHSDRTRIETLDAFRGIAVLAVLFFHYTYRWGPLYPNTADVYGYRQNVNWFANGWQGVEFFFIISGFVIFMTLDRCATPFEFFLRRFARLYPAFIVCMTLTFLVQPILGISVFKVSISDYLVGLTMASSDLGYRWVDGAYWSLLIEIKFYAWIALLYFAFAARFLWAWFVFCLVAFVGGHFSDLVAQAAIRDYLPFFTAGMGFYLQFKNRRIERGAVILFVAAGLMYIGWRSFGIAVHVLTAAMIVLFELFVIGRMRWLERTGLASLGLVSYPLYLLHQDIGVGLIARLEMIWNVPWPLAVVVVTAPLVALATAVHRYIEKPFQGVARAWLNPAVSANR
jgi:peptidoglycan/LPS O-acetylase OafA/YrhL